MLCTLQRRTIIIIIMSLAKIIIIIIIRISNFECYVRSHRVKRGKWFPFIIFLKLNVISFLLQFRLESGCSGRQTKTCYVALGNDLSIVCTFMRAHWLFINSPPSVHFPLFYILTSHFRDKFYSLRSQKSFFKRSLKKHQIYIIVNVTGFSF